MAWRRRQSLDGLLPEDFAEVLSAVVAFADLIAAVAERSGLTVLHNDKDFDLIADVTGQAVEGLRLT